ncbi:putative ACN9 family domain-containing protein [Aulographum hederae CBS 113979]|uniref:Succinate dehydrogenase assembly factor 3 n=1 Tax=Aulographum hederae CBS 113979 TaxID=1176131 RepID=A0A6G1H536_9PEZI|nr:putative ACN9 family domain-containing protein [Aulographum hederae CBS 113979]
MGFQRRMMATATNIGAAGPFKPGQIALLPPIPLYRRVLRCHRKLPVQMRLLGDEYVKSEFRAHKDSNNPIHIIGFLTEWQSYVQQVEGETWRGEKLDKEKIDKMSDQQIGQLYELMQAIRKAELEENDPEYAPDK